MAKNDQLTVLSTSLYIFKTSCYFIGEKLSCYLGLRSLLLRKSDMFLIEFGGMSAFFFSVCVLAHFSMETLMLWLLISSIFMY